MPRNDIIYKQTISSQITIHIILCTRLLINSEELKANLSAIMKNFKVSLSSVLSYHIPAQEQRSTKAKRAQHGDNLFYAQVIQYFCQ